MWPALTYSACLDAYLDLESQMFITQAPYVLEGLLGKDKQWYQERCFLVLNLQINGPTRKFTILKENNSHEKYQQFQT